MKQSIHPWFGPRLPAQAALAACALLLAIAAGCSGGPVGGAQANTSASGAGSAAGSGAEAGPAGSSAGQAGKPIAGQAAPGGAGAGASGAGAAGAGVAGAVVVPVAGSGASAGQAAGGEAGAGQGAGDVADAGAGDDGSAGTSAGSGGSAAGDRAPQRATWYVADGELRDPCGERAVLRGVSHPTLYVDRKGAALPEIAKTGANAVRMFWYGNAGVRLSEAEAAVSGAIARGMLPIIEIHDSTCAWKLDSVRSFWTSPDSVQFIARHAGNLIVNIANETSPPSAAEFRTQYTALVRQLRNAGIKVPLMIDGSRCGRDSAMLLSEGQALLDADPEHNLIFSAHLYDRVSREQYSALYASMREKKLPFVIGEFASRVPPGCGAALDYRALIEEADKAGIGWLAWSWGNNDPNTAWNGDCAEFDMGATFAFESLQGWGKDVAISSPVSIQNTAQRTSWQTDGVCR